ncbi:hypothetical protein BSKO_00162 [Bryopsis sp. KO-2023]|nr:hypothetical protein BSKO_00162 [Bryopsis sp. KO-2023]
MVVLHSLNRFLARPVSLSVLVRPWLGTARYDGLKSCRLQAFLPGASEGWGLLRDAPCQNGFSTLPFKERPRYSREKKARSTAENGVQELNDLEEAEEDPDRTRLLNSVIKVYCKHTEPNFSLPWQRKRQISTSSSGFMVSQGREKWVLTNAHSVQYYSQVQVKRRDDDRKFIARVLAIGTDCDIALLTVDEREFWEGVEPLPLGPLPRLQDYVTVVGYPIGGDSISVTSGVVSRIEMTQYSHGGCELLAAQIDAAINSGNSGGPVFNESGHCVGIAFQSYCDSDVENIGYMIPTPVIRHFLQDYHMNKMFTGFPNLGVSWQRMEAPDLRRAIGMEGNASGVLLRSVHPTSSAHGILKPGDVLMEFDGVRIANDGTVPFRNGERIMYPYLMAQKFVGDVAHFQVLRDGRMMKLQVELSRYEPLVPPHLENRDPSFFILAGFVFTTLNEHYLLSEYGSSYSTEAPVKLLHQLYCGVKMHRRQQVVVLSQVLASDATVGFEDACNVQVHSFNGEVVHDLNHLVEMVISCEDEYMRFDLDFEQVIVVNSELAKKTTVDVLEEHSIPDMASPDVMSHLENVGVLAKRTRKRTLR